MPWKECSVMEERLRFVARLLEGEEMSGLCREFGISRKTGYKLWSRYKDQDWRRSVTAPAVRCAMAINCRCRSRP